MIYWNGDMSTTETGIDGNIRYNPIWSEILTPPSTFPFCSQNSYLPPAWKFHLHINDPYLMYIVYYIRTLLPNNQYAISIYWCWNCMPEFRQWSSIGIHTQCWRQWIYQRLLYTLNQNSKSTLGTPNIDEFGKMT